jgi:glycosyltransferase involved in cell wall biosynthesis
MIKFQKNNSPLVSVIIPAYKARNFLKDALQSIRSQDYKNIEIIIVDDVSPEPIDDIVTEYLTFSGAPPLIVLRHKTNQGQGAARNTGIATAKGEYIALLDHDDLWTPQHLSDILEGIIANKCEIGFCSAMEFSGTPENRTGLWGPDENNVNDKPGFDLFKKSYVTPSSAVISKSLLIKLDGFNPQPEVHACEDLDLWLRIAEHGAKFHYSKISTVFYRKHADQATAKEAYMTCQSAYVRQLHVGKIRGPWFKKRSIVAANWWRSFIAMRNEGVFRWDLLMRAIVSSLPVPWEAIRGVCHLIGFRPFYSKL